MAANLGKVSLREKPSEHCQRCLHFTRSLAIPLSALSFSDGSLANPVFVEDAGGLGSPFPSPAVSRESRARLAGPGLHVAHAGYFYGGRDKE